MGSRKLQSTEETREKVRSSVVNCEHLGRHCHKDETLDSRSSLLFFLLFLNVSGSLRGACNAATVIPFGTDL